MFFLYLCKVLAACRFFILVYCYCFFIKCYFGEFLAQCYIGYIEMNLCVILTMENLEIVNWVILIFTSSIRWSKVQVWMVNVYIYIFSCMWNGISYIITSLQEYNRKCKFCYKELWILKVNSTSYGKLYRFNHFYSEWIFIKNLEVKSGCCSRLKK